MRDKHKSTRELRWDQDKEREGISNVRNRGESTAKTTIPLVSCLAFARPLRESKTSRPAPKTSLCFQDFHCHIPFL